jgi:hypothetical protein
MLWPTRWAKERLRRMSSWVWRNRSASVGPRLGSTSSLFRMRADCWSIWTVVVARKVGVASSEAASPSSAPSVSRLRIHHLLR